MNAILIYDLNYKMTESPLGFVDAGIKSLLRITIVIKTTKEIYDIKERNKNAKLKRTWMHSLWYSFTPAYLVFNCFFFFSFIFNYFFFIVHFEFCTYNPTTSNTRSLRVNRYIRNLYNVIRRARIYLDLILFLSGRLITQAREYSFSFLHWIRYLISKCELLTFEESPPL